MIQPIIVLSSLNRVDGSATFSQNGFTIIGVVNGPLEVSRRDENPEEAVIDVTIRPAAGTGGTRERHLEYILQATLRRIILVHDFPRTLIQITLQITSTPEIDDIGSKGARAGSNLIILPSLLQTATMALLSASIPLSITVTSIYLALTSTNTSRSIIQNPSRAQVSKADSEHVLAFSSHGDLLIAESEGVFSMEDWKELYEVGNRICCSVETDEQSSSIRGVIKSSFQAQTLADLRWKH